MQELIEPLLTLPDLPAGFTLRPVRIEDAAKVIEPSWRVDKRYNHTPLPLQDFIDDLSKPAMNLELDARAIFAPNGVCAGYVDVTAEKPYVRSYLFANTHTDYENMGLGIWMTRWGINRLRERIADAPPNTRVTIASYPNTENHAAIALLAGEGFVSERVFFEMAIDLDKTPELAPLPHGITLRTFDPERDVDRLFETHVAVFRDHYGFIERSRADEFERWSRMVLEHSTYQPELITLAEHEGVLVGYTVTWHDEPAPTSDGYVQHVGIVREWRRRGLAHALLTRVFATHYAHGAKRVTLGVDAASPTGALGLYEQAGMYCKASATLMMLELREGAELTAQE